MALHDSPVSVCIPARYDSSRFPGKPLALLWGKPLIQHVYEAAQATPQVGQVVVVTDHDRIRQAVEEFGGNSCLVTEPCRTGTDRVAKVVSQLSSDVVLNLQSDEIPLDPGLLGDLIDPFLRSDAQIGTLKRKWSKTEDPSNSSIVKVVTDRSGRALYFSRQPVPHWRDAAPKEIADRVFMHLGVYIFRKNGLLQFARLPTGFLEDAEKLEQLRALENGLAIQVWETQFPSLRIDNPEDITLAESLGDESIVPHLGKSS